MKLFYLLLLIWSTGIYAQSTVKGYVYNDANKNGKKEKKEKGVEGVVVSNGIETVLTNSEGYYELSVGTDNIIAISKPAGYAVPLNNKNQPLFYYAHKPDGSPDLKYKGYAPTGKLPTLVNFALYPQSENDNFTALIFGDPQPYTEEEIAFFSKGIVAEVEGVKNVVFGLSLGDLVGDHLDLHSPYIDAVQKVGIPWYNLMGNHDMNYDAKIDEHSDETYELRFGPANYSFNYGKVHYLILDDILYPDPRDANGYWGGFRNDQLAFIENDLKHVDAGKLVVVAFHIPLFTSPNGDAFKLEDRKRLFEILKKFPNVLVMSAHTHLQRHNFYTEIDGWQGSKPLHEYNAGTTSGDWYSGELNEAGIPYSTMRDGTPKGYAFIDFTGNTYKIRYKVAGKERNYQMRIYAPKVIPDGSKTSARFYANFFMGTQSDKVSYRIDNGEWKEMNFVEDADPSFLGDLYKWDNTDKLMAGRRPSNAVKSTHLWSASFPAGLKSGQHTIEIKAIDMFGQEHTGTQNFNVAD